MKNTRIILFLLLGFGIQNSSICQSLSEYIKADSLTAVYKFVASGWVLVYKDYQLRYDKIDYDSMQWYHIDDSSRWTSDIIIRYYDDNNIERKYTNQSYDNITGEYYINRKGILIDQTDSTLEYNNYCDDTLGYIVKYLFHDGINKQWSSYSVTSPSGDSVSLVIAVIEKDIPKLYIEFGRYTVNGNKVWIEVYREDLFYKNNRVDYYKRTQYNEDGSVLATFKDVYIWDANNRLNCVKYHTFDSTKMDFVFDGYLNVYGGPVSTITGDPHVQKKNSIQSDGKKIYWEDDISITEHSKLIIHNHEGKTFRIFNLHPGQKSLEWPLSLLPQSYIVSIQNPEESYSKLIFKKF